MSERILVGSIQKFSVEDGPGIRTTVFLKGCPLRCKWCHNPELIEMKQQLIQSPTKCIGCGCCIEACPQGALSGSSDGIIVNREKCDVCASKGCGSSLECVSVCYANALNAVANEMTAEEILDAVAEDKAFYDNTGGGMTISGGEMLTHADFVLKLIDEAADREINVCVDTSGFGDSEKLREIALRPNVTDILYDMKSIDNEVHREYTEVSNELILDNLKMLAETPEVRDKITMRMPLIKGVNDGDEVIKATGALYRELGLKKVTLLPYHNLGITKKRNIGGTQEEFNQPEEERLTEIMSYFQDEIEMKVEILGRL